MKKTLFIIMAFLAIISMTGCSQKQSANNDKFSRERGFARPDFGQPEKPADVTGLVKSISGNEVTIIKIERPQRNRTDGTETNEKTGNNSSAGTNAPALTNLNGGGASTRMPGAPGGQGGRGNWGGTRNIDEASQAAMLERLKEMSTGEVTVTIPVGIKMLKPDTSITDKPEIIEANLSDLIKDKMVNIWLDESVVDKTIASFVLITR